MAVRVEVLAVGQGMCNLIIDEEDNKINFFGIVDCGSEGGLSKKNEEFLIKYIQRHMRDRAMTRVEEVDYYLDFLMFSHADADHINFLCPIMSNMRYPDREVPMRSTKSRGIWYQENMTTEEIPGIRKDMRFARKNFIKNKTAYTLESYTDYFSSDNITAGSLYCLSSDRELDEYKTPIMTILKITGSFPFSSNESETKIIYHYMEEIKTHMIKITVSDFFLEMFRFEKEYMFNVKIISTKESHTFRRTNFTSTKTYYKETIELLMGLRNHIPSMKEKMKLSNNYIVTSCEWIDKIIIDFSIVTDYYSENTTAFDLDVDKIDAFIKENKETCIIENFILGGIRNYDGKLLTEYKKDTELAEETRNFCQGLSKVQISNLNRTEQEVPIQAKNIKLKIMSYKYEDLDFYKSSEQIPPPSENDCSLICSVEDRGHPVALLMGDATHKTFSYINDYHRKKKPVIFNPIPVAMTAPHHGATKTSYNKSNERGLFELKELVNLLSPQSIIISSGYRNDFGHPGRTIINYFYTYLKGKVTAYKHEFFFNRTDDEHKVKKGTKETISANVIKDKNTLIGITDLPLYNTAGSTSGEVPQLRYVSYEISISDKIILKPAFEDQDDLIIQDLRITNRPYEHLDLPNNPPATLETVNIINMKNESYFPTFLNEQ